MKLETIGPAEERFEGIAFELYGLPSIATRLMRREGNLSAHTHALNEVGRVIDSWRIQGKMS